MHKSIFASLFNLCYATMAFVMILIGSVQVFFSLETYHRDRREELMKNTEEAAAFAEARRLSDGSQAEVTADVNNYFNTLSELTENDYFLADSSGRIICCSRRVSEFEGKVFPAEVLSSAADNKPFFTGSLNGFYSEEWFNYVCGICGGRYYIAARHSMDSMKEYLTKLFITLLIFFAAIMILVYPVLYFSVMRIVKPLSDMTMAARKFGEGDFSKKIRVSDNTELGYLENALNEMAASIEENEEKRKSFVSNVSHELKTPMTTIGGFVDGILDGTIPKQQHKYYLRIVSGEIDRLARLVRSMLNISKYESGEVELRTEFFDCEALIFKTALLFETRIDEKKVEMEGLDSGKFYLCADIDLTQQIIYNLIENAVKFVNEGGTISFSHEVKGEFTAVRIRNSGEGLTENEISKVFDRFYKTDESRGKDKTGVGLGLSIVRSIVKLHNGDILVRSKPGEYTEFEFTLPTGVPPQ